MTNKELLAEAVKHAGVKVEEIDSDGTIWIDCGEDLVGTWNPLRSKSDLWDLAERAKLAIDFELGKVVSPNIDIFIFTPGNHESCALAVLNAVVAMERE